MSVTLGGPSAPTIANVASGSLAGSVVPTAAAWASDRVAVHGPTSHELAKNSGTESPQW